MLMNIVRLSSAPPNTEPLEILAVTQEVSSIPPVTTEPETPVTSEPIATTESSVPVTTEPALPQSDPVVVLICNGIREAHIVADGAILPPNCVIDTENTQSTESTLPLPSTELQTNTDMLIAQELPETGTQHVGDGLMIATALTLAGITAMVTAKRKS